MNDFIKLTYVKSKEMICVRRADICKFKEDSIMEDDTPLKCVKVYLSQDDENWIKVSETVDEIMEMLEHE
ncbi:MAG: hypothetical protein MR283_00055 [Erysipelotrichaceae bacterium]|nr:hypothetical protein [Erysipelotrichaceae bacterium]